MTISEIEILNFQSHKYTLIEPDPKLTFIRGTTDSGKSSIFRAIKLLVKNRPTGIAYKSTFSPKDESAQVTMFFVDESWASRARSGKVNQYEVSTSDQPLKAIRTDVPQEVSDILNLVDVNLQGQHDTFFMLQDSPGEVGRKFSEAAGLEIIDESIKEGKRTVSRYDTKWRFRREENRNLERQLPSYSFLEDLEPILSEANSLLEKRKALWEGVSTLDDLIRSAHWVEQELASYETIMGLEGMVKEAEVVVEAVILMKAERASLGLMMVQCETLHHQLKHDEFIMSLEEEIGEIDKIAADVSKLASDTRKLDELVRLAKDVHRRSEAENELLKQLEKEYLDTIRDLRICPLCLSPITDDVMTHLEEHGV